ncbi:hypothetical protein K439DRAFT_950910 [Ramaria rubella]|nr:hypothetical protein K439DRAFT_950910 [Ramaria rubella]
MSIFFHCESHQRFENRTETTTPKIHRKARTSRIHSNTLKPARALVRQNTRIISVETYSPLEAVGENKALEKRALSLLHDSRVTSLEERRVLCNGCSEWISLRDKYCISSWNSHISTCLPPHEPRPVPRVEEVKSKSEGSRSPKHRTEEQRAELLRSDPRLRLVESRRVLCGMCGLWIKLRNTTTYCPTPWFVHKERCAKRFGIKTQSVQQDPIPIPSKQSPSS